VFDFHQSLATARFAIWMCQDPVLRIQPTFCPTVACFSPATTVHSQFVLRSSVTFRRLVISLHSTYRVSTEGFEFCSSKQTCSDFESLITTALRFRHYNSSSEISLIAPQCELGSVLPRGASRRIPFHRHSKTPSGETFRADEA
jgi:hypothetical protein